MHFIDAHAHLSFYSPDQVAAMIKSAESKNVKEWIMAGFDLPDWQKQISLFQSHSQIKMCFGLHPWQVINLVPAQIDEQINALANLLPQAQACGETGIDGFKSTGAADLAKQEDAFIRHLELNKTFGLPLVLHLVQAHEAGIRCLKPYSYKGIVHGFSGSWEVAKIYIGMGYKISVGRGVFHKGYKHLKETVAKIDLKDLVIESDAYVQDDGTIENPVDILLEVAQSVAELKSEPLEKICFANYENIKGLFG